MMMTTANEEEWNKMSEEFIIIIISTLKENFEKIYNTKLLWWKM